MRRIVLCFIICVYLAASPWETANPLHSIVASRVIEQQLNTAESVRFKLEARGGLAYSSFNKEDTTPLIPGSISFFPGIQFDAAYRNIEAGLRAEQIVSAQKKKTLPDSAYKSDYIGAYRTSIQALWQPLSWMAASAGYNHYLASKKEDTLLSFSHSPSFYAGLLFIPADGARLGIDCITPCLLSFESESGIKDTVFMPLILEASVFFNINPQFDFYASSHFSKSFSKYDSARTILSPLGIRAGVDYKLTPSLIVGLEGSYSGSSTYNLEPYWNDYEAISVAANASWVYGPWRFSTLLEMSRSFALTSDEPDATSYSFQLSVSLRI